MATRNEETDSLVLEQVARPCGVSSKVVQVVSVLVINNMGGHTLLIWGRGSRVDEELRMVLVMTASGRWLRVEMYDLNEGDVFCLIEPDGSTVTWQGKDIFIASSEPYQIEGVWAIDIG
jgi:hypothetical protein